MRNRLSALDGIRGFAAFSVLLSHTGWGLDSIIQIPILVYTFKTFAVGPNSVQILFVLSGFLMAYLYPEIRSWSGFIRKRYARIVPVFSVVVIGLAVCLLGKFPLPWYRQILVFLILPPLVYIVWRGLEKLHLSKKTGTVLFVVFGALQGFMLLFNLYVTPRISSFGQLSIPDSLANILITLTNLTFTRPFAVSVKALSGVFWSLAPEIYFYLLYPFIVISLIQLGKKYGYLASVAIVAAVLKILFDLDHAFVPLASLQSINIARSSGFLAGVLAGTIYQNKGEIWLWIERFGGKPAATAAVLLAFFAVQTGDWALRDGQSITFMNTYYAVSSFIVAALILVAIIPGNITNKIFSGRLLVYLGFISYSIYLIHTNTIVWAQDLMGFIKPFIGQAKLESLAFITLAVALTLGIASLLFWCVEMLYFRSKRRQHTALTRSVAAAAAPAAPEASVKKIIAGAAAVSLFFIWVYTTGYSPSLLVSRHFLPFSSPNPYYEYPLLKNKLTVPVTGKFDNLSAAAIDLRYYQDASLTHARKKHPARLIFRLLDENKKVLFQSEREAYNAEGTPHFPFGIPTVTDSKEKKYCIELELAGGSFKDQVFVNPSSTSLVTVYKSSKSAILHNPFILIWNRLQYGLSNPALIFALAFTIIAAYGLLRQPIYGKRKKPVRNPR